MAKPDRLLNLALANLRRQWPAALPDFGVAPLAPLPDLPLLTAHESMRLGLVRAHRQTCHLNSDRLDRFLAAREPRTLIIHAVDAEPAVPLLAFWLLRHPDAIRSLGEHLAHELSCSVIFAIPEDLPDSVRRILSPLGTTRVVDAHYPGGHWRLMPRAVRLDGSQVLTVDAVAATDWIEAMITGVPASLRPVALADDDAEAAAFNTVARGTRVEALAAPLAHDERHWFYGARLADHVAEDDEPIDDGELTFYREAVDGRSASACIRCGACIAICPTRCDPVALLRGHVAERAASPKHDAALRRAGLDACIQCGLCTAACPSNIELHHVIQDLRALRTGHLS